MPTSQSRDIGQTVVARPVSRILGRGGLVDRYFYFFLSLVVAGIVVAGFSRTADQNLFHAAPPRPVLVTLGAVIAVVMGRFDALQLH
ncbi:hypothetical protein [Edaphobacter bradus]|uniref:hypothetical protein n=1 Tax=Edaphobacter bradus TaxID=2259016 RepID=UPI0021DFBA65|nr:hypothetical protein [Edaphobacter bradus]